MNMGEVIPFRPRRLPPVPDTRTRVAGALALALDAVDQMLAVLDGLDRDQDFENGGDAEPSLAAPENDGCQVVWLRGGERDLEGREASATRFAARTRPHAAVPESRPSASTIGATTGRPGA